MLAVDTITVYSPGSTGNIAPVRTISGNLTRLSSLSGIAVDMSGSIYVSSLGVEGSRGGGILIFAPGSNGNVAPATSIDGDCANLTTTGPIALDATANLYVGGYDKVVVFPRNVLFPERAKCNAWSLHFKSPARKRVSRRSPALRWIRSATFL